MQVIRKSLAAATLALVAGCSAPGGTRPNESIEIKETGDAYSLTVPISRLTLTLPRSNWVSKVKSMGGSTDNPRYFYFEDTKEANILSGWFEPDRLFRGTRNHWERDTQAWRKQGLPEPTNVSFEKVGGWEVILYDHTFGKAVNSHLRAHWVQAGTWIDVHISTTSSRSSAENRKKLTRLLRAMSISEKGGG